MHILISLIVLLVVIVCGGCQAGPPTTAVPETATPSPVDTPFPTRQPGVPTIQLETPERIREAPTKMPQRVPPTEAMPPVIGEAPAELLNLILENLVQRSGAARQDIRVIQSQAMLWPDGSLGCARPGEMYTQAVVHGYWIVLEVGGKKYDYRAAQNGYFFLCENSLPPVLPAGTPDS